MNAGGSDNLGDIRCRGCGYSLRGLRPDGTCPECGRPVSFSTAPRELRYGDPHWLRRVLLGVRLMLAGWAIIGVGPLAVAYSILALNFGWPLSESILAPTVSAIGIGLILLLAGAILSTAQNVWIDFEARWLRISMRAISILTITVSPAIVIELANPRQTPPRIGLSISGAALLLGAINLSLPLWLGVLSLRSRAGRRLRAWRWAVFFGLIDSPLFVMVAIAIWLTSPALAQFSSIMLLITLPMAYVLLLFALQGAAVALRDECIASQRKSRRTDAIHAVSRSNAS